MKKQIAFITAVCFIFISMFAEFQSFAEENIYIDTHAGVTPVKLAGRKSFNLDANDYPIRSSCMHYNDTVNSYLLEKDNNTLERVEYCLGTNEIIVENYSNDGNQLFYPIFY